MRPIAEQVLLPVGRGAREAGASRVIIAHHDVLIESGDHLIIFVENRRIIPKIETLFQVSVGFF